MLGPAVAWGFLAAGTLGIVLLPPMVTALLHRLHLIRPNYLGQPIPVGYGLVILLWSTPALAAFALLDRLHRREYAAMLCVTAGLSALGFTDDLLGDRSVSGLRGHFRKFFREGEITTGFLKAAGGALVGVLVPQLLLGAGSPDALLSGAVIALSANAFNLLDLRPGRAGAIFLLKAVVLMGIGWYYQGTLVSPLVFVFIPALLVYERDARAKVMLGDTGSNLLGGALGLSFVLLFPGPAPRLAALGALVAFHLFAERYSLSRIIEQNAVLRRLDRLTGVRS